MGKSYWMANQSGNYSNDKNDTFDESKDYIGIRLQQGVPLLDRDINELEDLRRYQDMNMRRHYVGDGTPDNGFEISKNGADLVDFKIGKGRYLVDGIEAICREEITYKKQTNVPALNPATGPRKDLVYIELTILEVDGPKNSQDAEVETCKRQQIQWKVLVNENNENLPPADPFKWRTRIALLERDNYFLAIKDLRSFNGGFNRGVGDLTVKGKLTVEKDTTIKGVLAVEQNAAIKGVLTAEQSAAIKGVLTAEQSATIKGVLTAEQSATIKGVLTAEQSATIKGVLTANNGITIASGGLTVKDYSSLNDAKIGQLQILSTSPYDSDVARAGFTLTPLDEGTVISIGHEGDMVKYYATDKPEDKSVIGVVSKNPRIILGGKVDSKSYLVMNGFAKCKFTGTIYAGEFLTSSGKEGVAMKANTIKMGDIDMYKPGTIIGRALETKKTSGDGVIYIFVMRF